MPSWLLAEYEKPVEGQVPSETFVGLQARTRIAETVQRNRGRRDFYQGAVKIRSIAEASKAIAKHRRPNSSDFKLVVYEVCPTLVELPSEFEANTHFNSASHIKWAERQVKAELFAKAQKAEAAKLDKAN